MVKQMVKLLLLLYRKRLTWHLVLVNFKDTLQCQEVNVKKLSKIIGKWAIFHLFIWKEGGSLSHHIYVVENFGPDLLSLFKLHGIWSVDSQENY